MEFLKGQLNNVIKYLTVAVVIGLISLLFPKTVGFQHNFQQGEVWPHEDLVAPVDFPILKSEKTVASERKEIYSNFIPYYSKVEDAEDEIKNNFVENLEKVVKKRLQNDNPSDITRRTRLYKNKGTEIINELTSTGIASEDELLEDSTSTQIVNLIDGVNVKTVARTNIISLPRARLDISDKLSDWRAPDADLILPLLNQALIPTIVYDNKRSAQFLQERLNSISTTQGIVRQGELIVRNNGFISAEIYQKLRSYKKKYEEDSLENQTTFYIFLGYLILTTLVILSFLLFLQFNAKEIYDRYLSLLFMLVLILGYSYLVSVIEGLGDLSTLMIPFCIVPILAITFFSDRVAFFLHVVIILLASFLSDLGYEFTFLQIFAGIVTVLTFKATRYWGKFFKSVGFILIASLAAYFGLSLLREGDIANIEWDNFMWLFISAFLTLLAFPLIPLLERIFGFTSSISLSELSDLNRPLLKRLSNEAPGTFQHSLQVSNLSESAAEEIGANTLLVKVAALYHDIGKLKKPQYFIENQSGYNPHDDLDEKESAKIIIDHVAEGVKMAKAAGIPKILIEFIKTHHGTTRVEYFYQTYKSKYPDKNIVPEDFTYPGPKPKSKEQAIMMIADSLEASSKTLNSPTGKDIDKLVDNIISGKIENGQLDQSKLSFADLEVCRRRFKKMLKSIHHVRIEYPDQKEGSSSQS